MFRKGKNSYTQEIDAKTNLNLTRSGVRLVNGATDLEAPNLTYSGVQTVTRETAHAPPDGSSDLQPVAR